MKSLRGFIKYRLFYLGILTNVFFKSRKSNSVILIGTPMHGNIGDQTIAYAEYEFFKKCGKEVVEIPDYYAKKDVKRWKKIIGNKRVYIHGGGFVGSVWPDMHNMLEKVIKEFADNEIVILPQTIDFGEDERLLSEFNKITAKANNITICAREKISFEKYKDKIENVKMLLIPDMVLSLKPMNAERKSNKSITLCFRNDVEKVVDSKDVDAFINKLKKEFESVNITDMVVDGLIENRERYNIYMNKVQSFREADWVVTDRLHGMVLSYMAGVPTIVLRNSNHKVEGLYQWIKDAGNVFLVNNAQEALEIIHIDGSNQVRNAVNFNDKYEDLINIIKNENTKPIKK